jgi:hypothetical protein
MSRKTRGSDQRRKGSVARDLTAKKIAELKGGIVTDNKDPGGGFRASAVATGLFRSVSGLRSETE